MGGATPEDGGDVIRGEGTGDTSAAAPPRRRSTAGSIRSGTGWGLAMGSHGVIWSARGAHRRAVGIAEAEDRHSVAAAHCGRRRDGRLGVVAVNAKTKGWCQGRGRRISGRRRIWAGRRRGCGG